MFYLKYFYLFSTVLMILLLNNCSSPTGTDEDTAKFPIYGENLIFCDSVNWFPIIDEYGSTIDTGEVLVNEEGVDISFLIVKQPDSTTYPFGELCISLTENATISNFEDLRSVKVKYKSNVDFSFKLCQTDFEIDGSYAHFAYDLNASKDDYMEVEFTMDQCVQPTWVSAAGTLNLVNVYMLSLAPVNEYYDIVDLEAQIEVNSVILYKE